MPILRPLDGPRNKEYDFPGTSSAKNLWLDGITDSPIDGTNLLEPPVEASRLKTAAVGPGPCLEIRLVLDSGHRRPVGGRDSCVIWCGESPTPRGGFDPPRGREETTQNDRRGIGSEPGDTARSRVRAPPVRRRSGFLRLFVRRVAPVPGGLRSVERTRRDDSKRPTWHRFRRGAGGARAAFRFGEPNDLPRGPTTYPTTYNRRQRL